jgi:hypothetical protein
MRGKREKDKDMKRERERRLVSDREKR